MVSKFKDFGLQAKIIVQVVSLIVIIMLVVGWATLVREEETILRKMEAFGKLLAMGLAERSFEGLATYQYADVMEFVQAVGGEEDVSMVCIFDKERKVCIASTVEGKLDKPPQHPHVKKSLDSEQFNPKDASFRDKNGLYFLAPVQTGTVCLGMVAIRLSLDSLNRELVQTRNQVLIITVLAIVLGAAMSVFLARALIRPVTSLVHGAQAVAVGDFSRRIPVDSGDEIGQLAESFNQMTGNVELLYNVSMAMNFVNDLDKLLDLILDKAVEALDAERGSLMLLDDQTDELMLKVVRGLGEEPLKRRVTLKIGEGIAGNVVKLGRPLLVNEGYLDPRFKSFDFALNREKKVKALVCVPLKIEDKPFGVINIVNKRSGASSFSEQDLKLLQALASQAAVAINNAKLYELAITDGLTKLFIHRYFQARLDEEIIRSRRYGQEFSIALFDIDHFKNFNDTYGHQQGDIVLREMAGIMKNTIRENIDIAARYGGEEFVVILPETNIGGAGVFAERLRKNVETHDFPGQDEPLHVTISIGCSCYPHSAEEKVELIKRADDLLYVAKEKGRNQVCLDILGADEDAEPDTNNDPAGDAEPDANIEPDTESEA